jgi:hypothetical protein
MAGDGQHPRGEQQNQRQIGQQQIGANAERAQWLGSSERPGIELLTSGCSSPPAGAAYPSLNCPGLCNSPGPPLKKKFQKRFWRPLFSGFNPGELPLFAAKCSRGRQDSINFAEFSIVFQGGPWPPQAAGSASPRSSPGRRQQPPPEFSHQRQQQGASQTHRQD